MALRRRGAIRPAAVALDHVRIIVWLLSDFEVYTGNLEKFSRIEPTNFLFTNCEQSRE